jgi:hypothetical protein
VVDRADRKTAWSVRPVEVSPCVLTDRRVRGARRETVTPGSVRAGRGSSSLPPDHPGVAQREHHRHANALVTRIFERNFADRDERAQGIAPKLALGPLWSASPAKSPPWS